MRISYNWLRDFLPSAPDPERTSELLTNTGLEVEGVEAYESIPGGLKGLVVGLVIEVWKHPDADRLRLTRVDVGNGSELQIVCGAPNVAEGQRVAVATDGTTLYPIDGEPFTIRKGKIRGEVSQGMLCAENEIGLGKGHDGIMVLNTDAAAGTPLNEVLGVYTDHCLEIGLTPNRTDAMSHLGVARDLRAAMLHQPDFTDAESCSLVLPDLSAYQRAVSASTHAQISIRIEAPEACNRYAGVCISGVKVGASPEWLQNRLKAIGLHPINNVVDVTNYVMHELGHPLHAFDLDTISGREVVIRTSAVGEKFTTLDGIERTLGDDDLLICDSEKPMCLAGVFGGQHSGISATTTEVFLESAVFDPVFVRRTARRHQLNTDASYRFERGVDAVMSLKALKRAALLIAELTGAQVSGNIIDEYPVVHERAAITLRFSQLNRLIGQAIDKHIVTSILVDLDFEITEEHDDQLHLLAPLYRRDVTREADVAEEILRIYGYNNIEIPHRIHAAMARWPKPDTESLLRRGADLLVARGFTEIMNNSLTRTAYADRYGIDELAAHKTIRLLNPLSSDLGQLRQSMLFQGLEVISRNINFKHGDLRLFEFGLTYHRLDQLTERQVLALWVTGKNRPENWSTPTEACSFADLRSAVYALLSSLGVDTNLRTEGLHHGLFSDAITISKGERALVRAGALASNVLRDADIRQPVFYAEFDWANLIKTASKVKVSFSALPKFPPVRRDLSLLLDRSVRFSDVASAALKAERKLLKEVGLFDVYEGKHLAPGKKSYALSFVLRDDESTLVDKKIDSAMKRILDALQNEFNAELRS